MSMLRKRKKRKRRGRGRERGKGQNQLQRDNNFSNCSSYTVFTLLMYYVIAVLWDK